MAEDDLIQQLREQRLMTLALADQISGARWSEPALPGDVSLHAMLSHLLGWDELLIAILEVSAIRELPSKLLSAYRDVDAFNARSVGRYANISRDDLLGSLQGSNARLVSSARSVGGAGWAQRRIPEMAPPRDGHADKPSRGPSVGGLLRMLRQHEFGHCEEITAKLGVTVDMEQLRADLTGTPRAAGDAGKSAEKHP
ncbi:MAG TPA: DinB family protein [Ktedonobacterales bacterium]